MTASMCDRGKKVSCTVAKQGDKIVFAAGSNITEHTFSELAQELYGDEYDLGKPEHKSYSWIVTGRKRQL